MTTERSAAEPDPPRICTPATVVDAIAEWLTERGHAPATDPASRHIAEGAAAGLLLALGVPLRPGAPAEPLPFSGLSGGRSRPTGPW